jgi:hypothetical protein
VDAAADPEQALTLLTVAEVADRVQDIVAEAQALQGA